MEKLGTLETVLLDYDPHENLLVPLGSAVEGWIRVSEFLSRKQATVILVPPTALAHELSIPTHESPPLPPPPPQPDQS